MIELRIAPHAPYVLYRVHLDGTEEPVSEHPNFRSGWQAGLHVVTVDDKENAYSLRSRERRVARFGHSRLILGFNGCAVAQEHRAGTRCPALDLGRHGTVTERPTVKLLEMLEGTRVAHDEREREAFERLSPWEQVVVTTLIKAGVASTVEEVMRDYAERREAHGRALEARATFRVIRNSDAE